MPITSSMRITNSIALTLSLSACSVVNDTNTLVIWHAWGGAELKALKALISDFKAAHPAVEVMALQVPYDKLKDKYTRSTAANGGPDLLIGDADWSGKFAASHLALQTDGELFTRDELARFHPSTLASLTLNGHQFAVPESRETVALYYNRKLIGKAPETLPELFAASKQVSERNPGTYGFIYNAAFYYLMGYFFAYGGQLFEGQSPKVEGPAGRQALELLDRVANGPGMLASPEYSKGDGLFKDGKVAMILNGPWALGDYQAKLGTDLGVAPLPRIETGAPAAPWVGVKCMMFNPNSDSAHRKMARDFALYVSSPAGQTVLSRVAGHIPATQGVTLPADSPITVFAAQADVGTPVSIRPEISFVWEPMDKAVRQVIQHQAQPAQALTDAAGLIAAKLQAVQEQGK